MCAVYVFTHFVVHSFGHRFFLRGVRRVRRL
jgi:hypothetical protein